MRLLITAGPTYEPIDAVRFIGNRSSGRLGISLAEAAACNHAAKWSVTLLLGPSHLSPRTDLGPIHVRRFESTADLQALLAEEAPRCDVLIMAAAVADYRARQTTREADRLQTKIKRSGTGLTLELEATPDLLAMVSQNKRSGQVFIGFALEPRERLLESARQKLERKRLDLIVANPLETMDSPQIEATILEATGVVRIIHPPINKTEFARILLEVAATRMRGSSPEHP